MRVSWNDPFVDKIRWILSHLDSLHVDPAETVVLLLLQFMAETGQEISHDSLAQKSHLSAEQIEGVFSSLAEKGYLKIDLQQGRLVFILEGLAEQIQIPGSPMIKSLLDAFEQEFGRPLSSSEIQRIIDLAGKYNERKVIVALNEAVAYSKVNLNYIENILASWQRKGYSIEDVENGKR